MEPHATNRLCQPPGRAGDRQTTPTQGVDNRAAGSRGHRWGGAALAVALVGAVFAMAATPVSAAYSWSIEVVDPESSLYLDAHSLVLDTSGTPHVIYDNATTDTLTYASRSPGWSSEIVSAPTWVNSSAVALEDRKST